jgi:transcriptional regulator with XRE-family HTH domain
MDSDDKNGGPNNLRAWRLHCRLSQEQLAAKVVPPTSTNMIQYLESGERGLSLKWLRRLADAMEIPTGYLADMVPPETAAEAERINFWSKKLDKDELRRLAKIAEDWATEKTGTADE